LDGLDWKHGGRRLDEREASAHDLKTWLSVLGVLLSAEGSKARRRRKGSTGVWREGSSWMRRAWRAARMVV
jgi:hypothetical protein